MWPAQVGSFMLIMLQVSDAAYETKKTTKSTGRSVVDNLKGGANKVGRALHLVADSTESECGGLRDECTPFAGPLPTVHAYIHLLICARMCAHVCACA